MNIEPFGYFRALPFGWDSCGENDEGAMPLYDQKTVDDLLAEIERQMAHLDDEGLKNDIRSAKAEQSRRKK